MNGSTYKAAGSVICISFVFGFGSSVEAGTPPPLSDDISVCVPQFDSEGFVISPLSETLVAFCSGVTQVLEDTMPTSTKRITDAVGERTDRARKAARGLGPAALSSRLEGNVAWRGGHDRDNLAAPDGNGAVASFMSSGYAAGDHGSSVSVWGNVGLTRVKNDFFNTEFFGTIVTGVVGVDYWVTDRILVGGFGNVENTDVDTKFNGGEMDGDGFTAGIYVSYLLGDRFSVDGQFGYTFTDIHTERTSIVTAAEVSGSTDSHRLFGSLAVTGDFQFGNVLLSPTVRHILAQEKADPYTESNGTPVGKENIDLGLLQVGGRASYLFEMFEPFVSFSIEVETLSTTTKVASGPRPRDDIASGVLSAGVDFSTDFVSGGLELTHNIERENLDESTMSANLSFSF